jgi:hypothetical protein
MAIHVVESTVFVAYRVDFADSLMSIEEQADSDNLPNFPLCPESANGELRTWDKVMNEPDATHFKQAAQAE